ncbi:MAG: ferritin family protein [Planctomycetota bacterium]|nr:ferritin family protein [Planctomycetota bacterium]
MPNDIKSILETAISEEKKASRFYSNLALQMEDKGARLKFEIMAATEQKHYGILLSYYKEKFRQTPVLQETGENKIVRPEIPPKTASFGDAIEIIMDAERRAYGFYKKAFENSTNTDDQEIFKTLADMEQSHFEQFRTEYNYMTETIIRFASEDIPWMMEVY